MTRDSLIWWIGILGGVATGLAAHLDQFSWLPDNVEKVIELTAFIVSIISGKMATSPLPSKAEKERAR